MKNLFALHNLLSISCSSLDDLTKRKLFMTKSTQQSLKIL